MNTANRFLSIPELISTHPNISAIVVASTMLINIYVQRIYNWLSIMFMSLVVMGLFATAIPYIINYTQRNIENILKPTKDILDPKELNRIDELRKSKFVHLFLANLISLGVTVLGAFTTMKVVVCWISFAINSKRANGSSGAISSVISALRKVALLLISCSIYPTDQ